MRILMSTLGLAAIASVAMAHPPVKPVQQHGNPHTTTTATTTTAKPAPTTTTTTTTTTPPPAPLNPIAAKITSHPQLASKLTPMLPKGMTLDQASLGFKNQGQFIATLHVSQNLGIPFKDLRTQMVTDHKSLGQSIQTLKTTTDSTTAVTTAEHQADDDVKTTTTTSTTGSTTKPKGGK